MLTFIKIKDENIGLNLKDSSGFRWINLAAVSNIAVADNDLILTLMGGREINLPAAENQKLINLLDNENGGIPGELAVYRCFNAESAPPVETLKRPLTIHTEISDAATITVVTDSTGKRVPFITTLRIEKAPD